MINNIMRGAMAAVVLPTLCLIVLVLASQGRVISARMIQTGEDQASHKERFLRGDPDCGYYGFHYKCYDHPPRSLNTPSGDPSVFAARESSNVDYNSMTDEEEKSKLAEARFFAGDPACGSWGLGHRYSCYDHPPATPAQSSKLGSGETSIEWTSLTAASTTVRAGGLDSSVTSQEVDRPDASDLGKHK